MNRRDFLRCIGLLGLSSSLACPWNTQLYAADNYTGPLWISVHAGGGWDPTSFCDPKGSPNLAGDANPMNRYDQSNIEQIGPFRYAPTPANTNFSGGNNFTYIHRNFFQRYSDQILVVNGINAQTNNHRSGTRNTWSGQLPEGYPAFSALVSASLASARPLSFVSNGGYDYTDSIIPFTRIRSGSTLEKVAYPNRRNTANADQLYLPGSTISRIVEARKARDQRRLQKQGLPHLRKVIRNFDQNRSGDNELRKMMEILNDANTPSLEANISNGNRRAQSWARSVYNQARNAIAAYKVGIASSVNISVGGYDTHGNHDANHYPRLVGLIQGVDYIMREAAQHGLNNRIVVMVGSDFGRTPRYNNGNGKDHWPVNSMLFMGPGITGNRVIGSTDSEHNAEKINPTTLTKDDHGIHITPAHIHKALRSLAGIDPRSEPAKKYPIDVESLALFG